MRLTVERTANILIIATALVALPIAGLRLYDLYAARTAPAAAAPPARYTQGETFSDAVPIDFGAADRAVLVYVSSSCKYCTNSMDFYRRLAAARAASNGHVKFIVVGGERPEALDAYMKEHGVDSDQRLQVARGTTKLSGTPTLLVVSRARQITGVWFGQLSAEEEQHVLGRLRG